jgi:uncharacterized protein YutE (UPF0331/DUF86 family)
MRVAREYERNGYSVVITPDQASLPEPLSHFCPDAVARKGEEGVVIEVKTRRSLVGATYLPALAETVQRMPGWRLDLVVTNPREKRTVYSEEQLSEADIRGRIGEAKELSNDGSDVAAMLLAWSAVEGALRLLAHRHGIKIEYDAPDYVLRQLVVEGLLSHEQYRRLRSAAEIRNTLVHGFSVPHLEPGTVRHLAEVAEKALSAQPIAN